MSNIVDSAVKNIYIDSFGNMYFLRFDGTSKLVGKIIQEADYLVDDENSPDYIKNKPLDNSDVKNNSIRYIDGTSFVASSETEPVEISSIKRSSIAFNVIEFKEGLFFSAGDTVMFNDALWMCIRTCTETKNPSISKNFKLVNRYEFAKKICELEDTRLSAVITAEDGTSQTSFRINSIFDLYFHSEKIDLPNNENPEEFKKYASVIDGQITVGTSIEQPSILLISFAGIKTISFDLKVFNMIDNLSVLAIKKNNDDIYRFEKNENGEMTCNGIIMESDKIITEVIVDLQDQDKMYIDYTSTGVFNEALPFIISNLIVSY